MTDNEPKWTSITVTKPTLRLITRVKSLLEYKSARKMTNNEALIWITIISDYYLAKEYNMTQDDFKTFMSTRLKDILDTDENSEAAAIWDDIESFQVDI